MTTREYLLLVAESKLGKISKGSPEVEAIWRDVLRPDKTDAQVKDYARQADWCGGFVLHCLREAELTDVRWRIGSGFVLPLLGDAVTKNPRPGDIGIRRKNPATGKDVWHHFLVESWRGPGDWDSIDGNTPYCERKHHEDVRGEITFYSIEKLLPAMPEPGFPSDTPWSVPGVQDG